MIYIYTEQIYNVDQNKDSTTDVLWYHSANNGLQYYCNGNQVALLYWSIS